MFAVGMRRLYAILLVCVIGWPMLWPVVADASGSVPHACCLRKHHCGDSGQTQIESPQNHDCCRTVRTVARIIFEPGQPLVAPSLMQPLEERSQYTAPEFAAQTLLPVRAPPAS